MKLFWSAPPARSNRVGSCILPFRAGTAAFRTVAAKGRGRSGRRSSASGRCRWMTAAVAVMTFFALCGAADAPLAFFFGPRQAVAALDDTLEAVCRITAPDGSRGTGCAFEHSGGRVYVLTAAHVVGGADAVWCEFWHQGRSGARLPGRVAAVDRDADAAVLAIDESAFTEGLPRIIAPDGRAALPSAGTAITSAGCAAGGWPTAFKGVVVELLPGELCFVPPPANGRSGSPLLDAEGRAILGVIRARTADNTTGIATPIVRVFQAFSGRGGCESRLLPQASGLRLPCERVPLQREGGPQAFEPLLLLSGRYVDGRRYACSLLPQPSKNPLALVAEVVSERKSDLGIVAQCPGDHCPGPTLLPFGRATPPREAIPLPEVFGSRGRLLPPERTPGGSAPAGPLPQSRPKGSPAVPDGELRGEGNSPEPTPRGAAESAHLHDNLPGDSSDERTLLIRELVRLLIGDPDTLLDRAAARAERLRQQLGDDASAAELARGYARDVAAEKLADGRLGWTAGKMLAAALGLSGPLSLALAGGLWLVSRRVARRIEQSEPLIVERLWQRISRRIGERISDRWDGSKDQPQADGPGNGGSSSSSAEARHAEG